MTATSSSSMADGRLTARRRSAAPPLRSSRPFPRRADHRRDRDPAARRRQSRRQLGQRHRRRAASRSPARSTPSAAWSTSSTSSSRNAVVGAARHRRRHRRARRSTSGAATSAPPPPTSPKIASAPSSTATAWSPTSSCSQALGAVGGAARLGQILVEQGALTPHDLYTYVRKQVEEIFFSVLVHATRRLLLLPHRTRTTARSRSSRCSTKQLLFDGVRRIDELAYFREKLPSPDVVLQRRHPAPPTKLEHTRGARARASSTARATSPPSRGCRTSASSRPPRSSIS